MKDLIDQTVKQPVFNSYLFRIEQYANHVCEISSNRTVSRDELIFNLRMLKCGAESMIKDLGEMKQ